MFRFCVLPLHVAALPESFQISSLDELDTTVERVFLKRQYAATNQFGHFRETDSEELTRMSQL